MKQRQFKFWWGIGLGTDETTTGTIVGDQKVYFVTREYVFLCMKWGVCKMKINDV